MFAALLFGVLMLRQPCSDGVAKFVGQFDPPAEDAAKAPDTTKHMPGAKKTAAPTHEAEDKRYIRLRGDMSEEQIRETLRHAGIKDGEPAKSNSSHAGSGEEMERATPASPSAH